MPKGKAWEVALKVLLTLGLFGWLINYANVKFVELFANITLASPILLLLAMLLFLLHTIVIYIAWHKSLAIFEIHSAVEITAPLFAFSTLTKYVPGGVWHAGSRVFVLGNHGYSKAAALFSVIMESIVSIFLSAALLCFLFSAVSVDFLPSWVAWIPGMLTTFGGAVLLACILSSKFYRLVFDWYYARKLGTGKMLAYNSARIAELVLLHLIALCLFVVGYYLCFIAYLPELNVSYLQFAFIIMLATFSGFIAIFSPAGLGVRESILYVLFALLINSPLLVTVCLAPRLVLLLSEVLFFLCTRIFHKSLSQIKLVS